MKDTFRCIVFALGITTAIALVVEVERTDWTWVAVGFVLTVSYLTVRPKL